MPTLVLNANPLNLSHSILAKILFSVSKHVQEDFLKILSNVAHVILNASLVLDLLLINVKSVLKDLYYKKNFQNVVSNVMRDTILILILLHAKSVSLLAKLVKIHRINAYRV